MRDGDTPQRAFLTWLTERYENSAATWDMRDLIDPSTEPDELVTRARGRHDAAHSGIMDHVVTDFARDWGHMTGEDTVEVEQEALRRLEFIASSDTSAEELQAMMSLTGKTSVNELAELQYDEYQARLTELRDLKATIAEGLATAVEVLAAAALTVATAGATGGALVAAVGSAIAGMVAREALQGTDYELFDEENAKRLLITAISGGVAEYIGPAVRNLEAIERLGAASAFVRGALTEGSKSITSEGMSTLLAEHMPTVEILTANALKVLGSTLGSAMSARMAGALDDIPIEAQIIPSIRASIAANMVSGVSDHASTLTAGTSLMSARPAAGHPRRRSMVTTTTAPNPPVNATRTRQGARRWPPRTPSTVTARHCRPIRGRVVMVAEIDAATGTTSPLGPVDSQAAPGRSAHAVPVGEIDRTQPLEVSGFAGSTSATPGFGAFAHTITTERGDQVPAVIKILPPGAADVFAREVAGAQATATAGVGPPYYGIVDVPDGLAFAMGVVPGGFTENFSLDPEGSPQHTLAEQQTQDAVGALTSQAPQDVRNYAAALVHLGYHCTGDLQGLVADDGCRRAAGRHVDAQASESPRAGRGGARITRTGRCRRARRRTCARPPSA